MITGTDFPARSFPTIVQEIDTWPVPHLDSSFGIEYEKYQLFCKDAFTIGDIKSQFTLLEHVMSDVAVYAYEGPLLLEFLVRCSIKYLVSALIADSAITDATEDSWITLHQQLIAGLRTYGLPSARESKRWRDIFTAAFGCFYMYCHAYPDPEVNSDNLEMLRWLLDEDQRTT